MIDQAGNIELSRRVSKLMNCEPIVNLEISEKSRFADEVDAAENYAALPKIYQQMIVLAERSMANPKNKTMLNSLALKHLQGMHNQKKHGYRGAKAEASQSAQATNSRSYVSAGEKQADDVANYVKSNKSDSPNHVVDPELGAIFKMQGFDGKPRVASKAEVDDLVKSGATEAFRGIIGDSAVSMLNQFADGDLYVGSGLFGNGTYTAMKQETAQKYGENMMRMAIDPKAKIADFGKTAADMVTERASIEEKFKAKRNELFAEYKKLADNDIEGQNAVEAKMELLSAQKDAIVSIYNDLSRYAAMKGIDAISVFQGDKTDLYYIVLNRTAVTVQKPFYVNGVLSSE